MGFRFFILLVIAGSSWQLKGQSMIRQFIHEHWQFKQVNQQEWLNATVPGTVHTDLMANERVGDPYYRTNEKNVQWIDKAAWEYRTEFPADSLLLSKERIELVFEGLDTYADVYLNDQLILQADNFFVEWRADVRTLLVPGENRLRIHFHSPIQTGLKQLKNYGFGLPAINDQSENGGLKKKEKVSVFTRKPGYHYGWDWGPRLVPSGIWRPVFLEAWNTAKIDDLFFYQQSVRSERATLEARFTVEATSTTELALDIMNGDTLLATQHFQTRPGTNTFTVPFYIRQPQLWWTHELGEPYLYNLHGHLRVGTDTLDRVDHQVGIRTIEIVQDKDAAGSSFYFKLNGVPVFAKGANYIPNDVFIPRVTKAQYRKIIHAAAKANMNMLRVWGGGFYENELFYRLCNESGILVWQDFMFACSMYPGNEEFLQKVQAEARYNIKRLRNHPSIALWCGNNEMDVAWSQYKEFGGWWWKQRYGRRKRKKIWAAYEKVFHDILPEAVRQWAPDVFYWPSSPYAAPGEHSSPKATKGDIHYWGVWHGKEPFVAFRDNIGRFMSEYGFQSFPEFETVKRYTVEEDWDIESEVMAAHQRSGIGNLRIRSYMADHYRVPRRFEHLLYVGQLLQAKGMQIGVEAHRIAKPYCMGSLYWQLNDCWPVASWSSVDYYQNWKALQYRARDAFAPVIVAAQQDKKQLSVYIVSDRLSDIDGTIQLTLQQFNGDHCWSESKVFKAAANTSTLAGQWSLPALNEHGAFENVVLSIDFTQEGQRVCSTLVYLTEERYLNLPKSPQITASVIPSDDGYFIDLETDQLAKNVFIGFGAVKGAFSDNYFDLLPKSKVRVQFTPDADSTKLSIADLQLLSLADTY